MRQTGINMEIVKRRNRYSILNFINESGPISRKDIAAALGLTPAAVTQICGEFIESGILVEKGIQEEENRSGRKKVLLDIEYDHKYVFGINIEPEKTTVALTNLKGDAEKTAEFSTETGLPPEEFLGKIASACQRMQQESGIEPDRMAGAGVGITGIAEKNTGISVHAYGIWREEVPVGDILKRELCMDVIVENNVTAFALAELLYGIGKEKDNLLFVKWGPGVGSAIVTGKKIYEGRNGKAAELGHFIVEKNGRKCGCGRRGCLETKLSFWAVKEQLSGIFSHNNTPFLYEMVEGNMDHFTINHLMELLSEQVQADSPVEEILEELLDLFARTIVNSMTILAPNRVILCGSLFGSKEVRRRITRLCSWYEPKYNEHNIVGTALAGREAYIGPVALFVGENLPYL